MKWTTILIDVKWTTISIGVQWTTMHAMKLFSCMPPLGLLFRCSDVLIYSCACMYVCIHAVEGEQFEVSEQVVEDGVRADGGPQVYLKLKVE